LTESDEVPSKYKKRKKGNKLSMAEFHRDLDQGEAADPVDQDGILKSITE